LKISDILRRVYDFFFSPYLYYANLVYDKPIYKSLHHYSEIKKLQLDEKIPIFLDRQYEITSFFGVNNFYLFYYFMKNGYPQTSRFKKKLYSFFHDRTNDDKSLKKAYENSSFCYSVRLCLAYQKYSLISVYLDFILTSLKKPISSLKVLDYGCGISDIGLLFAKLGANVTIADLDNKKFDFAKWRYEKRKLPFTFIPIKEPSDIPILERSRYDLVIIIEVFEHVRDPFSLLKMLTVSLKKDGLLFDSMAGSFDRLVEGDHLAESIKIGNSKEYRSYFSAYYRQVLKKGGYLFKKIR